MAAKLPSQEKPVGRVLTTEANFQQADLMSLLAAVQALRQHVETLQSQTHAVRAELDSATTVLQGFAKQFAAIGYALHNSTEAVSALATALETHCAKERERATEIQTTLTRHRDEQTRLAATLQQQQETLLQQLCNLEEKDARQDAAARALAQGTAASLRETEAALRRGFESITSALHHAAEVEQAGSLQLKAGTEKVLTGHRDLARQFLAINAVLDQLKEVAEQSVESHETIRAGTVRAEAIRHNTAGLKALAQGDPATAAQFFHDAAQLAPDDFAPQFNRVIALARLGNTAAATAAAVELEAAFGRRGELLVLRGTLALLAGDAAAARQAFEVAAASPAFRESCLCATGLAQLLTGEVSSALAALRETAGRDSSEGRLLRRAGFGVTTTHDLVP